MNQLYYFVDIKFVWIFGDHAPFKCKGGWDYDSLIIKKKLIGNLNLI